MEELTAKEFLANQHRLEQEAGKEWKYDFSECTHYMPIERQQMHACLSCLAETGRYLALCYSCAVNCHTTHEIANLGTRRDLTCDCGTVRGDGTRCELRHTAVDSSDNAELKYNHNFNGEFCDCNARYNADIFSPMLQCLLGSACGEDWYHASCLLDRENENIPEDAEAEDAEAGESQDSEDEMSDSIEYPEGFPTEFDAFICYKCVAKEQIASLASSQFCAALHIKEKTNLFLMQGYANDLATSKDPAAKRLVEKYEFLSQHESTFYPKEDSEATLSLEEASERALRAFMPHETAIDGAKIYRQLSDKLAAYLKPIAAEGKVVTESDIRAFFSQMM